MKESTFKTIMIILGVIIAGEALLIIIYPPLNTHKGNYAVRDWFPLDGKMRLVLEGDPRFEHVEDVTLNLTAHFPYTVEEGHTYRIKWVDGLNYDYVLKWEEVPR